MMKQDEIEKRMQEIRDQIKDKQEEIKDEIVPGSYFYDVEKVEMLKKEIEEMQKEYDELDEVPTIEKVDADIESLNEKLAIVEEELKEANGSYFFTDDMQELEEQRKESRKTIVDRTETKEILVELEKLEEQEKELEEELNDLSGAYFVPEDITKEIEEVQQRKQELEKKLQDKKVTTKSKELQEKLKKRETRKPEPTKQEQTKPEPTETEPAKSESTEPEPTKTESGPPQPKDNKPKKLTAWDKFRNSIKNIGNTLKHQWKKMTAAFLMSFSALGGSAAAPYEEKTTQQGVKLEIEEVPITIDLKKEIDVNDTVANLKKGDIITLKPNARLFNTSNLDMPVAIIEHLTESGVNLTVMVTKIVGDKVHFTLVLDGSEPADLIIGKTRGTSKLLKEGELNDLDPKLLEITGGDLGWMTKAQLLELMVSQKQKVSKEIEVPVPVWKTYEKEGEETKSGILSIEEYVDKLREKEQPIPDETNHGNRGVRGNAARAQKESKTPGTKNRDIVEVVEGGSNYFFTPPEDVGVYNLENRKENEENSPTRETTEKPERSKTAKAREELENKREELKDDDLIIKHEIAQMQQLKKKNEFAKGLEVKEKDIEKNALANISKEVDEKAVNEIKQGIER